MSLDIDYAAHDTTAPVTAGPLTGARRRLRVLATGPTTPDRLRRVGCVLVVGCLLTAVVGLAGATSRAEAVRDGGRVAAVNADAAQLYRSLADADAMATSGFVSGGQEPAPVRARYDRDLADAADRLMHTASLLPEGDPAAAAVAAVSAQLPIYSGLVETARTYNRLGLPLGQSYLDSASRLMATTILPAVEELRRLQAAALTVTYDRAGAAPIAVLLFGLASLAALVDVSVMERRRTNRVLSGGLLAAGAAVVVALLWWVVATSVAGSQLGDAGRHTAAATALDDAHAAVLQARSNESLVLVARSGGSADQGFVDQMARVLGTPTDPGLLAAAATSMDDTGAARVEAVRAAAQQWLEAHRQVRELDDAGRYREAVTSATGADGSGSGAAFDRLDAALGETIDAERAAFRADADAAAAALAGLVAGPAVLTLLAAGAAAAGIGRRLGEYR